MGGDASEHSLGVATIGNHTGPMKSPCINVCEIDRQSGLCTGCLRTLDEIAGWSALSDGRRAEIMRDLERRRQPGGAPGKRL